MYSRVIVVQSGKKSLEYLGCADRETEAQRLVHVQIISQWPSQAPCLFLLKDLTPTTIGTPCQYFSTNDRTTWLIFDIMQMKETRLSALLSGEQEMKAVWGPHGPRDIQCHKGGLKEPSLCSLLSSLSSSQPWLVGLAPNPHSQRQLGSLMRTLMLAVPFIEPLPAETLFLLTTPPPKAAFAHTGRDVSSQLVLPSHRKQSHLPQWAL